ncbi:MAG: glucose-phosphate thymidylyltransferase [Gemmatimonadetes bacterium]|nr:glucose-phosphate thymidylyltransferase [Gemmatimonadota bacterium]
MPTTKALILARGLGTRMRKADDGAALDAAQASAADSGIKGMIPIGRPFMDYLISALADAGFTDVCLVIGPEHEIVRDHYEREVTPTRVRIAFAVQKEARGTADAVLAAEEFAKGEPFVVINSDNYYPPQALAELQRRHTPALIAFERNALVSLGNVPADRVGRFGALEIDDDGALRRIVATPASAPRVEPLYASLNCWLFTSEIFRACRAVVPSARGELELPQAVQLAIANGWMRFEAVRMRAGVLDMSSRGDVASVAARLSGTPVVL